MKVLLDQKLNMVPMIKFVFNFLPNDKILALTKLKTFADDKFSIAKMMIPLFDQVENIVEKGENAGHQHFLLFPPCFQKVSDTGSLKFVMVW